MKFVVAKSCKRSKANKEVGYIQDCFQYATYHLLSPICSSSVSQAVESIGTLGRNSWSSSTSSKTLFLSPQVSSFHYQVSPASL